MTNLLCKLGWHKKCKMKMHIPYDLARTTTKDNGKTWSGHGWIGLFQKDNYFVNDFFLIKCKQDGTYHSYQITNMEYCGNPPDMFFYEMKHVKKKGIPGCVLKQLEEIGEKIEKGIIKY